MNPLFIAAGLGAILAVLVLSRLVRATARVETKVSVIDARAFSRELADRTAEYLRANYSGSPAGLESALYGLVPMARDLAARHQLALDDDTLRTLIAAAVGGTGLASRSQAESALGAALRVERRAA